MEEISTQDKIKNLAIICAKEPLARMATFKLVGQILSKESNIAELKKLIHLFWSTIIKNHKNWLGVLVLTEYYRRNKKEIIYLDILYTLRESWAWCLLYPQEADKQYIIGEKGEINFAPEHPKPRLMEKEYKVITTKNAEGAYSYENKKPLLTHKLKSGFTYEGAQLIFEYLTVGWFEPTIHITKTVIAPKKKYAKKSTKTSGKELSKSGKIEDKKDIDLVVLRDKKIKSAPKKVEVTELKKSRESRAAGR